MDLIFHGVYDAQTLKSLLDLKIPRIGFDLRGRSLNLIPFHTLKSLVPLCRKQKLYLSFENDRTSTILSFLDLLGDDKNLFTLEFRDTQTSDYYASFNHPFSWFFNPEADWESILNVPHLTSLVLSTKWKEQYQNMPKLWHMIQERNLEVILHVDSINELSEFISDQNLCLSVDLTPDLENGFRKVDQDRLKLQIWRNMHESLAS